MIPAYIIVHHSLTEDGNVVDWQGIRRYHTSWRYKGNIISEQEAKALIAQGIQGVESPWADIGYHYGIEQVNGQYEILLGRMPTDVGAHCVEGGMNRQSLGICVVGNYDVHELPGPALQLLTRLVVSLTTIHKITKDHVKRHTDYAPYKSCPGTKFPWDKFLAGL